MNYQIDKVDNTDRKDLLRKKNKDRIPCQITNNRKLSNMRQIINEYLIVLKLNLDLEETFQNNPSVAFKRNKNLQEIIGDHTMKNPFRKRKRKIVKLATQINHRYVASRSFTPVHSEITKHSNYALDITSSTVKANLSFT